MRPSHFSLLSLLKIAFGLTVAAVFIWLCWHMFDHKAIGVLNDARWGYLALGGTAMLIGYTLRGLRWLLILRYTGHQNVSFITATTLLFSSFALNNILPLRAGDIYRCTRGASQLGASPALLAGTLIAERVFDMLILLTLLLVGLTMFSGTTSHNLLTNPWSVTIALSALLLTFIGLLRFGHHSQHLMEKLIVKSLPANIGHKLTAIVSKIMNGLTAVKHPFKSTIIFFLSLLAWACEVSAFMAVAVALAMPIIADSIAITAIGSLSTMIPSSPGHAGTFDFFVAQAVEATGHDTAQSLIYALVVHIVVWLPITASGLMLLLVGGKRLNQDNQAAEIDTADSDRNLA